MANRFIVAEISKNWKGGRELQPTGLIQSQFEEVIAHNLKRGYLLHSFQLCRLLVGADGMNEAIIAVFEREE